MSSNRPKHIFVTGGVVSSLGKGLTAASLANLLKGRGYKVQMQKLDPYLNVDPGTMSPFQHGEVFVTDDGAETDLDLGHYERFADITCTKNSNYTSGKIYSSVIARERRGGYLGGTVQVIPHITDEIKKAISAFDEQDVDIVITEIGGTAGDIESLPYLEAIRQYRFEIGRDNGIFIHLVLLPYLRAAGEMKTKPAQQSSNILRGLGISPDILICRCEHSMAPEHFDKLALFCNVDLEMTFEEKDVENSIYEVPVELAKQGLDTAVLKRLGLPANTLNIKPWEDFVNDVLNNDDYGQVEIAVIGKYTSLKDAYKSIYESIDHAGINNKVHVKVRQIEAEEIEKNGTACLDGVDGILVPGGFGDRGIEGKITSIQYARENNIPLFGICLGMQCTVIEYARNVLGMTDANSVEFNAETKYPVIDLMLEQKSIVDMGGTMRLGAYPCTLKDDSLAAKLYGSTEISERHRHRYEFNDAFKSQLEENGLVFSGTHTGGTLCEIVELPNHPFFLSCQFHPEFKSRPLTGHPIFIGFIAAAKKLNEQK
ncbi:MAG: CTP synthase [Lentisphaeria bacterium]|nr:CTP synthase [Lentisphaeria bacterium]